MLSGLGSILGGSGAGGAFSSASAQSGAPLTFTKVVGRGASAGAPATVGADGAPVSPAPAWLWPALIAGLAIIGLLFLRRRQS